MTTTTKKCHFLTRAKNEANTRPDERERERKKKVRQSLIEIFSPLFRNANHHGKCIIYKIRTFSLVRRSLAPSIFFCVYVCVLDTQMARGIFGSKFALPRLFKLKMVCFFHFKQSFVAVNLTGNIRQPFCVCVFVYSMSICIISME